MFLAVSRSVCELVCSFAHAYFLDQKGLRFLLVNASATVVIEAFNSSVLLVATSSQQPCAANFVTLPFAGPGIDIPANSMQYVSARTSLLWRRWKAYAYNVTRSNGALTYVNGWYQYPTYTNPPVLHSYQNSDYFVEPVFCAGSCASRPYISVTAPNAAVTLSASVAYTITYQTNLNSSTANVQISLSTDCGATYSTVIAASTPATGSYTFTPPLTLSITCRIKVSSAIVVAHPLC